MTLPCARGRGLLSPAGERSGVKIVAPQPCCWSALSG